MIGQNNLSPHRKKQGSPCVRARRAISLEANSRALERIYNLIDFPKT